MFNKNLSVRLTFTTYDMPEYRFSLTRVFPYEGQNLFLFENIRVRKNLYYGILYAVIALKFVTDNAIAMKRANDQILFTKYFPPFMLAKNFHHRFLTGS